MKYPWLWWTPEDLRVEWRQLADEGRDSRDVAGEFARLTAPGAAEEEAFQAAVDRLFEACLRLPLRPGYGYEEPDDLAAIRAARPAGPRPAFSVPDSATRRSRLAGAWLGRCAGCLLGKPVEGVPGAALRALLDRAGLAEIDDYLWRIRGLAEDDYRALGLERVLAYRDCDRLAEDDDPKYTILGMLAVRRKGLGFAPADVGDLWLEYVPILRTFTAERAAYRNFIRNLPPPRSAVTGNPYREWIGAQIRADFYGYLAPGRPELAAELAWRDASISHVKNGIYGAMWVAAMLAAAAVELDPRRIVAAGLAEIPARCRLAEALREVVGWHETGVPYAEAAGRISRRWSEADPHEWIHVLANAQVVALGLLYGEGDFGRAIARAVQPGFDTDCNGATVGSVMGMALGLEALPAPWTAVLNDTLDTGLPEFGVCRISRLAGEMFEVQESVLRSSRPS